MLNQERIVSEKEVSDLMERLTGDCNYGKAGEYDWYLLTYRDMIKERGEEGHGFKGNWFEYKVSEYPVKNIELTDVQKQIIKEQLLEQLTTYKVPPSILGESNV